MTIPIRLAAIMILGSVISGCLEPAPEERTDFARERVELLLGSYPETLVVEIDFAPGREPSSLAITTLLDTLENVTDKVAIHIIQTMLPESDPRFTGNTNWTNATDGLHDEFFDSGPPGPHVYADNRSAFIHVFYLNGYEIFTKQSRPLGKANENLIILYPDVFRNVNLGRDTTPAPAVREYSWERMERAVLIHETGHALGLVGYGAPVLYPDRVTSGSAHSKNDDSVMSPTAVAPLPLFDQLAGEVDPPYQFDKYDLEELNAVRAAVKQRLSE